MAEITLERLEKTDIEKHPSNTLVDYDDIIHKLAEAIASKEGMKTKGDGAHQELIEFLAKQHKIDEQTRQFLQQMRNYRNNISYEGFAINKNYITENNTKIWQIIKKLQQQLD